MHDLQIALLQAPLAWEQKDENLEAFRRLIGAISQPADLILLPEMFNTGFSMRPEDLAERMDGATVQWMMKMASDSGSVVAGTLMIREKHTFVNRLVWVYPDGNHGWYDKRHLFRMGNEADHFSSGRDRTVFSVKGWNILPLTCYDLRFPSWSMNQFRDESYAFDLLVYLANWPASRNHHWRSLLIARAIENQAFVAGVNRTGVDGTGLSHCGNSMIISPFGEVLADADEVPAMILEQSLDYDELIHYRKKLFFAPDWDDSPVINSL